MMSWATALGARRSPLSLLIVESRPRWTVAFRRFSPPGAEVKTTADATVADERLAVDPRAAVALAPISSEADQWARWLARRSRMSVRWLPILLWSEAEPEASLDANDAALLSLAGARLVGRRFSDVPLIWRAISRHAANQVGECPRRSLSRRPKSG